MGQPKISVIIPVYNTEKYLRQCLDSVVNQTLKEIEVICVDDGSTDSSLEILEEYAKNDNRFIILKQENKFAGVARNYGMSKAKGKYLYFMDSDDFIETNALEIVYKKAEEDSADIIIFGHKRKTKHGTRDFLAFTTRDVSIFDGVRASVFGCGSTIWDKLFNHEFIKSEKIEFEAHKVCNDVFFMYKSMLKAKKISQIQQCFYTYREDAGGALSRKRGKNATLIVKVLEHIKSELEKEGMFKPYKNIFYNAYKGHLKYESKQCSNIWQKIKLYCAINLHDLYRMYGRDFIRNLFKIERTYNRTKISFLGIKLKVKKGLFKKICKIERNHNRIKINFLGVKLKIRENLFDKVKKFFLYPVAVREEYKQLKQELKALKKN